MKYLFPVFFLVFLMFPLFANAQSCDDLGSLPSTQRICELIGTITNILYIFGISLAIIMVIVGGIMYMTAGADESKVGNAKKTIIYGLIGAAIVFLSGFIIGLLREVIVNGLT